VVASLAVLAAPSAASSANAGFSFDSDAQGWLAVQGGMGATTAATYQASGGNPGGYVQLVDTNVTDGGSLSTALAGDFSSAYGGVLSADLKVSRAWSGPFVPYLQISGTTSSGRCVFSTGAVPADGSFHTITAVLTETTNPDCTWSAGVTDFSRVGFQALLAHTAAVVVSADVDTPVGDTVSLDNLLLIGVPDTSITSTTPALITTNSATITFAADPSAVTTFECQLDGAQFTACSSPDTLTGLSDGPHSLAVRAVAGPLKDPTPATVSFAVDSRALPIVAAPLNPPRPTAPSGPPVAPRLQNVVVSGGTVLFTTSRAGSVRLTIARRSAGHKKKGHRCSTRLKHGARCTFYTTVFTTSRNAKTGAGRFTFGRGSLRRGTYRATLTLTVPGAKATSVAKTFTVK
jgi:hypothetical protein